MSCKYFLFLSFLSLFSCFAPLDAQEQELKGWCKSAHKMTADEKKNIDHLHHACKEQMMNGEMDMDSLLSFPLRIGIVRKNSLLAPISQESVLKTIGYLNAAFKEAGIRFYVAKVSEIHSPHSIGDLSADSYAPYLQFSEQYDLEDTISLFLFDYDEDLCKEEHNAISCGRTGGFSYILSEQTNNVVLSKFDLEDHKIIVHEFGHFFGLYHTFEKAFGKELISGKDCETTGDMICDTPADPGPVFEVYVNYSRCDMLGHRDAEQEAEYHPLINNYMSYYKPCYLKPYTFSPMQLALIHTASQMDIRRTLAD